MKSGDVMKRLVSTARTERVEFAKSQSALSWTPEYQPVNIVPPSKTPDALVERWTRVSYPMIAKSFPTARKTKIICTLGPACWSEEGIAKLIDAGMNVARFNFSHGDHEAHQAVLDRVRKVAAEKGVYVATALDTKGPEIRTAMLRDGKDIELTQGQEVVIRAVGDAYTSWEGYQTPEETVIGCSYAKLATSVEVGATILIADGTISCTVLEVINDTDVRCKVLNTRKLGQRKNMCLPGRYVDIPVLTDKDIDDVQNFACRNKMDLIFASFVQTANDVRFIRKVLQDGGGGHIQIMSKVESTTGLVNYDAILAETDGVMVARGDLGMEIPSEKVALAQKMMIIKANLAGKFITCATEMIASMQDNPLPTRAEMTDVANAVFDGVDATMLSGESANGKFPDLAVATMAAIVENAELGVDYAQLLHYLRYRNAGLAPVSALEASMSSVAIMAANFSEDADGDGVIDATEGCLIVALTATGAGTSLLAKYRPCCPVVVVSDDEQVLRASSVRFGQYPCLASLANIDAAVDAGVQLALAKKLAVPRKKVIVVSGAGTAACDTSAFVEVQVIGEGKRTRLERVNTAYKNPHNANSVKHQVSVNISIDMLTQQIRSHRETKIVCTLGPACWSEEGIEKLLDAGLNIARFNFSHGDHAAHQAVLDRFHTVAARKAAALKAAHDLPVEPEWATALDTKGPEVRTAMLRDGKKLSLKAGQTIIVEAVGDRYTEFQGYQTSEETRIGVSYAKLCQSVRPGNRILIADGTIVIEVTRILNNTELEGVLCNSNELGERKNVNLPGVHVDLPVLTEKDVQDVQDFACRNQMNYIFASFVQKADDVRFIRAKLDEAGGVDIKIVVKIENDQGLANFDEILAETDGVMVARGDLGMEIPSEKVCLAQKYMITKANLAGKFVITATQMLASMETNPLPTRAEMTDVANAVFDGTDATMLSGESANGKFPDLAVATMAAIVQNAEEGVNAYQTFDFIRNFTPKPMTAYEATCSSAVEAAIDMDAKLIAIVTNALKPALLVAKYRPPVPVIVLTNNRNVARLCNGVRSLVGAYLPTPLTSTASAMYNALDYAQKLGLADFTAATGKQMVILTGRKQLLLEKDYLLCGCQLQTLSVGASKIPRVIQQHSLLDGETTIAYRSTKVSVELLKDKVTAPRKTKIVCTLGPACWSEEGIEKLIDAGMNVCRFNFSHGDHAGHGEVLARVRKVAAAKGANLAYLLDTKGPEIRTAMLRNHEPLQLRKDQDVRIVAVGSQYTSWEGYEDGQTAVIGVSYDKLCKSVKPGNRILIADGTIVIEVVKILTDKELLGRMANSAKLGERKNVNLPGVHVELPVLTEKDIHDLQDFCCHHRMDMVAASFVQTGNDVRMIRTILDMAGGVDVKIICKIENEEGLKNYDAILAETDGIMVARGDLGMEIPSEKVALAQKYMITKANLAGKFVLTATQMLASMETNPLPTRAEMTDVANAVFDGTDATMLSGESANGKFPDLAVATMAAIVQNAEEGVNAYQTFDFIRNFTPKPLCTEEAVVSCAAKNSVDIQAGLVVVVTGSGRVARFVAKYRPSVPLLVVTDNEQVKRQANMMYAAYPYCVPKLPREKGHELEVLLGEAFQYAVDTGLCPAGREVITITGAITADAEQLPTMAIRVAPGMLEAEEHEEADTEGTLSMRSSACIITLPEILTPTVPPRKTKIICTLGPACWSEEGIAKLIDAGMNVARFNFSHGDHAAHQAVLNRLRKVVAAKGVYVATMLDTKGPEIRTAMLRDGKDIHVQAGQMVKLVAVGDAYTSWEGYQTAEETVIGCSYAKLCHDVGPGSKILVADGTLSLVVTEVSSAIEVMAKALNSCKLGQRKNMALPGVRVDLPVLTDKDIDDVQNFACRNNMDIISASFVQSPEDVMFIRKVLNEAGGSDMVIMSKIESLHGLLDYDYILEETDGIMVARGDLGMEIPSEKVALAQKMMITKARIAGKFIVCATEMLSSMQDNPLPTRAEMTDVANAVYDGVDATMLSGESANGKFPDTAVATMASITRNAEMTNSYQMAGVFLEDHSVKPFATVEAVAAAVSAASWDAQAGLLVTVTDSGLPANLVSKYQPPFAQIVASTNDATLQQTNVHFGQVPLKLQAYPASSNAAEVVAAAKAAARAQGLWDGRGAVVVMHGRLGGTADTDPVFCIVD